MTSEKLAHIKKEAARTAKVKDGCKPINLALQGGGSHGAFTWGVLDKILEDHRVSIHAVSATSAGAMNAVVMADGLLQGGPDAAREKLQTFWGRVSAASATVTPFGSNRMLGHGFASVSPVAAMMDMFARSMSPYQWNPFDLNPLRDILTGMVDFERIRANHDLRIFLNATHVKTGKPHIFETAELTGRSRHGFRLPADALQGGGNRW